MADRIMRALRQLIREELANLTYAACWEYVVTGTRTESNGDISCSGSPTAAASKTATFTLPDCVNWRIRPGVAGAAFKPAAGSFFYVTFANSDPAKPIVIAFDKNTPAGMAIDSTGTMKIGASADEIDLAGGDVTLVSILAAKGRVVRYGDPCLFPSPGQGVISPGAVLNSFSKVKA